MMLGVPVDVLTEVLIDCPRDQVAGFAKVAAPLMASAMRRANQKDLARLKSLLEKS